MERSLVQSIRALVIRKMDLMRKKNDYRKAFASAGDFFASRNLDAGSETERKLCVQGAQRMVQLINELQGIEEEIREIDTLIITALELESNDFKFTMSEHITDAGDLVPMKEIVLTVEEQIKNSKHPLTVDNLWTVLLLKEMYKVSNIDVERRPSE